MSESHDALFAELAAGEAEVPADPRLVGAMRQRVADAQRGGTLEERRDALAVSKGMISRGGLEWLAGFSADPDVTIRREALHVGEENGEAGMPIVRAFLCDNDPGLSLHVLAILTQKLERTATTRVRSLLSSRNAQVRAAAAHLLGYIAGPVVKLQLQALANDDASPGVRQSASAALDRIEGLLSRNNPMPWAPTDEEHPDPTPQTPVSTSTVLPTSEPSGTDAAEPVQGRATQPSDLLATLGANDADDATRSALAALPEADVRNAIREYRAGASPLLAVGGARAATHLGLKTIVGDLRRRLDDPHPDVRSASVLAVARLGGPAVLPQLSKLLHDSEPDVVTSAIQAVTHAIKRLDMVHMAGQWLTPLTRSQNATIQEAAKAALADLGVS